MTNLVENAGVKLVENLLTSKNKPYLSVLLYLASGIVECVGWISVVAPFNREIIFLNSVVWKRNLSDSEFIVQFAFWVTLLYWVFCCIRKCWIYLCTNEPSEKIRAIYMHLYTIDDLIDLVASVTALLLAITFFLQVYNTGIGFISLKSSIVYTWTVYRSLAFIYIRFKNHNLKIIDNTIKKHPGLG